MKRSKITEFLYDFFGAFFFTLVIFACCFACSDNVRSLTKDVYNTCFSSDSIINTDTIPQKSKEIKDSVIVIKNDTSHIIHPNINDSINNNIDTIPLIQGNDKLYYFYVKLNGIPMKFALDTGCSTISISIVEYLFLERQGLVKPNTTEKCTATLANGESEDCFSVIIDSITVGKHKLKNIECIVSPNQNASLLLGQDVLSKLGEVTIKYNKQILIIE